jgi:hypothetical protein
LESSHRFWCGNAVLELTTLALGGVGSGVVFGVAAAAAAAAFGGGAVAAVCAAVITKIVVAAVLVVMVTSCVL